ncbi:hypothetical protein ACFWJQ_11450 [Streptomyces goshikiensis]|uniref:hypothetical protein n=1 Tax=Streptomyces goshikiensis TaxID=1942 RepID=UPI003656F83E
MDDALWSKLSVEAGVEVDELITAGRNVQALKVMREYIGLPRPALWDCVEALQERADVLEVSGPMRSRARTD